MSNSKAKERRVKRTQDLMKAGSLLREYRDRIDDILQAINSDEGFQFEVLEECVNIGINLQSVGKLLNPWINENQDKYQKREWRRQIEKMRNSLDENEYLKWLEQNSHKIPQSTQRNTGMNYTYTGPNQHFIETYINVDNVDEE